MDEARVTFQMMIAGNTLAGLTLVFLGNIATSYQSYNADERSSVRTAYKRRAWSAFFGFISAIAAALCAFGHNWWQATCLVYVAAILLAIAVVCVVVAAINTARGIK